MRDIGVPTLRHWLDFELSLNDAGAITLLALITRTEDTNRIHRGGAALVEQYRHEASPFLSQITVDNAARLLPGLDQKYICKNLSPGGCTDLQALSHMFFFLQQLQPS